MNDPTTLLAISATLLAALALAGGLAYMAWRGWLELKRLELTGGRPAANASPAFRIEMADLRERVRRLEAIASGVTIEEQEALASHRRGQRKPGAD